jgi:hypothetical protein
MNKWQKVVCEMYAGGDYHYLKGSPRWLEQLDDVGDTLFTFLMIELSDAEDCEDRAAAPRECTQRHRPGHRPGDAPHRAQLTSTPSINSTRRSLMGWTYFASNGRDTITLLKNKINEDGTFAKWEWLDHAQKGSVVYAVVRKTPKGGNNDTAYVHDADGSYRFILVLLTSRKANRVRTSATRTSPRPWGGGQGLSGTLAPIGLAIARAPIR